MTDIFAIFANSASVIAAAIIFVLILGIAIVFSRLYTRASKEQTFIRTGLGGEKVIMDGGALVFPVIHEVIHVNMNTIRLEVTRRETSSLITKDKLRVDVIAEFYVRVGKTVEFISAAAQTLGSKTLDHEELKSLIEGKFVDALRNVAARMTMMELHEMRKEFVQHVQETLQLDLEKNGLELESVSLTGLDQTDIRFFNANNAFDAEGLTTLTSQVEEKKAKRNDIEQTNKVAIERKKVEADTETYTIRRDGELAKISQEKDLAEQRARTDSEVAKLTSEQQQISELAEITKQRNLQEETINSEKSLETARIEKDRDLRIAEQDRAIAISKKSEDEAKAKAAAETARGEAVRAEEQVETARQMEIAERSKSIAVTKAQEVAEQNAVGIKVSAEAEKSAAIDRADAVKIGAKAEAERETLLADAKKVTALAEAEGLRAKNDAENSLSAPAIALRIKLATIEVLPAMIAESVKPINNIDGIKIVDFGGGFPGSNNGSVGNGGGSTVDRLVDGAMNYRVQAPLIDGLMKEIGLDISLSELVKKGGLGVSQAAAE